MQRFTVTVTAVMPVTWDITIDAPDAETARGIAAMHRYENHDTEVEGGVIVHNEWYDHPEFGDDIGDVEIAGERHQ